MGLTVTVKSDPDDYYYTSMAMNGFRVFTFYPYDYPDMYCGGLTENFVPLRTEVFMKIEAYKVNAVDALSDYTVQKVSVPKSNEFLFSLQRISS